MKNLFVLITLLLSVGLSAQNFTKADYTGKWRTYDDNTGEPNGKVEIYFSKGALEVKVLEGPYVYNADGSLRKDVKNPDPKLRSRYVKGMNFLYGFEWNAEDKAFVKGKVYDSRTGKTYSAKLQLVDKNKLKLTGYMGITLFGKTVYWTRLN